MSIIQLTRVSRYHKLFPREMEEIIKINIVITRNAVRKSWDLLLKNGQLVLSISGCHLIRLESEMDWLAYGCLLQITVSVTNCPGQRRRFLGAILVLRASASWRFIANGPCAWSASAWILTLLNRDAHRHLVRITEHL